MAAFKDHRFSTIFPLIEGEEFDHLVADIQKHGQREPIVLYEGQILDGRNRYRACMVLQRKPRFRELQCPEGSPLEFVWSSNIIRRHMNKSQISMASVKFAEFQNGAGRPLGGGGDKVQPKGEKLPADSAISQPSGAFRPTTIREVAKKAGISTDMIGYAKVVQKEGTPEQIKSVETGEKNVRAVCDVIRQKQRPQNYKERGQLKIPQGSTIVDWIRQGLAFERSGASSPEAATRINCGRGTYSQLRTITLLHDRLQELPAKERPIVAAAYEDMLAYETPRLYETVSHIGERLWGNGAKTDKSEQARLEAFQRGILIINHASTADLEIPQLTKEQAAEAVSDLKDAVRGIHKLIDELKETFLQ